MKRSRGKQAPPQSAVKEPNLVPLSCPDCFGVLRFQREGKHGHLAYVCQVDHRYTAESLVRSKEDQLEQLLWSASLLLTQMAFAYEDYLGELPDQSASARRSIQRRIREVRDQCLAIRAMIETSHAPE